MTIAERIVLQHQKIQLQRQQQFHADAMNAMSTAMEIAGEEVPVFRVEFQRSSGIVFNLEAGIKELDRRIAGAVQDVTP